MKLSINPQTFKSHYSFYTSEKTHDAQMRLLKMQNENLDYNEKPTDDINLLTKGIYGEAFVCASNRYDKKIENILASRGIEFHKRSLEEMETEKSVLSRIEQCPYDKHKEYYLLDVDVEKFDEAFQKSGHYIGKFGKGGIGTRYLDFQKYLKSGLPIHASTVVISEENGKPIATFVDGRHRYSVMRDRGFSRIPISMNTSSMLTAEKYDLLKD